METAGWKKQLRTDILARRSQMGEEERRSKSEAICSRIIGILQKRGLPSNDCSLFSFVPFGHEADIGPVIDWGLEQGYSIVVPKTVRTPRMLRLHQIAGRDELVPGVWGILEPPEHALLADHERISVVLVPGVAFDRNGGRLGYGGGYYDRLLAEWAGKGWKPLLIAAAFGQQMVAEVPLEEHDMRMDLIVTEDDCYYRGKESSNHDGRTVGRNDSF